MEDSSSRELPVRAAGNPIRRLTALFLVAVLGLVTLLVVGHLHVEAALDPQRTDPPRINEAGRQRMLARELARAALELRVADAAAARADAAARLARTVEWLSRAHLALQRGDPDLGLPANQTAELKEAFRVLDPHERALTASARRLLRWAEAAPSGAFPQETLRELLASEARFVAGMEQVVARYQADAEGRLRDVRRLQRALTGLVLGVLALTSAFVFVPALRLARREFSKQEARLRDEQRESERIRQLSASARHLASLVESSQDAILSKTLDGRITSWNRGAERLYGYSADEVRGRSIELLVPPEAQGEVDEILARVRRGESLESYETVRVRRDGSRVDISLTVSPIRDEGGEIVGASAIGRDISERKRAEQTIREKTEELERSNRELDEFASTAAHDLQAPLRKIVVFSELIREDIEGELSEAAERDLGFVIGAARHMQTLVQALLALSRVQTAPLERQVVSLEESTKRALDLLELQVEESGARIERDPLPVVEADPTLVDALYQNLIGNALKFAANGPPRIRLTARKSAAGWLLGVCDNGIGVPPRHRDDIFKPFRRLHAPDRYPGAGIGLAICRRVVERHGGTIRVEDGPEGGAHFLFTLEPPQIPGIAVDEKTDAHPSDSRE